MKSQKLLPIQLLKKQKAIAEIIILDLNLKIEVQVVRIKQT